MIDLKAKPSSSARKCPKLGLARSTEARDPWCRWGCRTAIYITNIMGTKWGITASATQDDCKKDPSEFYQSCCSFLFFSFLFQYPFVSSARGQQNRERTLFFGSRRLSCPDPFFSNPFS